MIEQYTGWILGGYIILMLGIGLFTGRKQTKEGFLIAERKLKSAESALSILATKVGGGTLLAFIAYVYVFGSPAMWYIIGFIVGYIMFYFFSRKMKDEADENQWYSLLEYIKSRMNTFGYKTFSFVLLGAYMLVLVMQLIGAGTILNQSFAIPIAVSIVIIAGVVLAYLLLGGFKAVVTTDAIQAVSFIAFMAIIVGALWKTGVQVSAFDSMPITLVIGFFLIGILASFSSHELWQRVFATRKESLSRALIGSGILYVFVGILLVFFGLAISSLLPGISPESAVVLAAHQLLDGGMQIVALLAFFAIILSTADTILYSTSSILVQDVLNPKNVVRSLKISFIGISVFATLIAIFAGSFVDVVIVYACAYALLGTVTLLDWVGVSMKTKRAARSLFVSVILVAAVLWISGLNEASLVVGVIAYPLFIGLQKLLRI